MSFGRSVIKKFMPLNVISAGSGLWPFILTGIDIELRVAILNVIFVDGETPYNRTPECRTHAR